MTRTRNVHIQFWLSEAEAKDFNRRVRRSGLSREAYLRQIIRGLTPHDQPPHDYFAMMNEVRRVGVNLNQLAARAHASDYFDTDRIVRVRFEVEDVIRDITETIVKPQEDQ
jgi:hypothetical protein